VVFVYFFQYYFGQNGFLEFSRKEAVFGKTNYSPLSFSLGPTYEQNVNEIDFSTCATARSIFVESRS